MFISPVQTSPQSSIDTLPRLAPAPVCEQADLVIDELDGWTIPDRAVLSALGSFTTICLQQGGNASPGLAAA